MTAPALTVNVTREHISQGEPRRCCRCPVALALLAVIPGAIEAHVYLLGDHDETPQAGSTIRTDDGQILGVTLPPEAAEFILAFDGVLPVSPFSFEVEVARP